MLFSLSLFLSFQFLIKNQGSMELFLEFLFTVSLSFVLSFVLAKVLSSSSVIDQHLEAVSRSCTEVTTKSEKSVLECEKGAWGCFRSVKVDALGDSVEEKGTLEKPLNGSYEPAKIIEETIEENSSVEESFVKETTEIKLAQEDEEEIEVLECEKENGGDCSRKGLSDEEEEEDGDWEEIQRTELEKEFGAAVCFLNCRCNADQTLKLGNDVKMQLYGLHKMATEGPCHVPQPTALKLSARAKWNVWKRLGNMSPEAAMEQYIALLSISIPGWTQDDICGDGKQTSADVKASWKLPLDVETMPENQPIAVNYRTFNFLKTHI